MPALIDESLPKRIRREMPGFQVFTVAQRGWSRTKNGALLRLAESAEFDAFLTADQSLQYQRNLAASRLRIIVFVAVSNRMEHIGPLLPEAIAALRTMAAGELRLIGGRRVTAGRRSSAGTTSSRVSRLSSAA